MISDEQWTCGNPECRAAHPPPLLMATALSILDVARAGRADMCARHVSRGLVRRVATEAPAAVLWTIVGIWAAGWVVETGAGPNTAPDWRVVDPDGNVDPATASRDADTQTPAARFAGRYLVAEAREDYATRDALITTLPDQDAVVDAAWHVLMACALGIEDAHGRIHDGGRLVMPALDVDPLAHLRPGDNGEPVRAELRATLTAARGEQLGGCRRRHPTDALVCCRAWGHPGQHIALRAAAQPSQRRRGPAAVAAVWPATDRPTGGA